MHRKFLTLLALIGLAGLSVPAHAQVLKGKEATKKASTKNTKAKKDATPATDATQKGKTKSATKTTAGAAQKTDKKLDQASPK